jgi:hypothetical protein
MRVFLVFSMVLIATSAFAIEAPVSLQTLSRDSDRIVRGKVTSLQCHPGTNEFGDELIFTEVSIRTDEALKGERTPLLLTVEGGTFNGVTLTVSDAPTFSVGEDVVVFAKKALTTFRPVFGGQSKYTISRDGIIAQKAVHYNELKKQVLQTLQQERRKLR